MDGSWEGCGPPLNYNLTRKYRGGQNTTLGGSQSHQLINSFIESFIPRFVIPWTPYHSFQFLENNLFIFFYFLFFQIVCKSSFYFLNILILNLKPNWNYWCYWPYIFKVHVRFTTIHLKPKFKWLKQRWERYCRFFWKNISICYINAQKKRNWKSSTFR